MYKWKERQKRNDSSNSQSQSYITTDSQSASSSWYKAPIWDLRLIFPILSLIIFRQFHVCWCWAPSLTRSRVCTFQFLPYTANAAFPRSDPHGTLELSSLSLFLRLPQPGGPGSCIYSPQEQGSPVIPPGIWLVGINKQMTVQLLDYRLHNWMNRDKRLLCSPHQPKPLCWSSRLQSSGYRGSFSHGCAATHLHPVARVRTRGTNSTFP
jgi:hypothetical protein